MKMTGIRDSAKDRQGTLAPCSMRITYCDGDYRLLLKIDLAFDHSRVGYAFTYYAFIMGIYLYM